MRIPKIASIATLFKRQAASVDSDVLQAQPTKMGLVRRIGYLILAILLFLAFIFSATLGVQRSFLLQGESSSIRISFSGGDSGWLFHEATICSPLDRPNPRGENLSGRLCPSTIFDEEIALARDFRWQQGEVVRVTVGVDGFVQVEVIESSNPVHPIGTLIVLSSEQWRSNGALAFEGFVEIGEDIAAGSTHYLLSGRWEARQTSFATSLLRSITDVVKTGELARGTQAAVYLNGNPASTAGHLTPSFRFVEAFEFVLISEPGRTELHLEHYGLEQAVVVRPDWIDTAITSPLFLAAMILFTLLAPLMHFIGELMKQRALPRKEEYEAMKQPLPDQEARTRDGNV